MIFGNQFHSDLGGKLIAYLSDKAAQQRLDALREGSYLVLRLGSGLSESDCSSRNFVELDLFTIDEVERAARVFRTVADQLAAVVALAKVEEAMQEEPEAVVE